MANPLPHGHYLPPHYYGSPPPGPYPLPPHGHPPPPHPGAYYVPGAVMMPYPMYPAPYPVPVPDTSAAQPPTHAFSHCATYNTNHYYNTPEAAPPPPLDVVAPEVKIAEDNKLAGIEWIPATNTTSRYLEGRAVVAGHEGWDDSPLWVIRAFYNSEQIPGKLNVRHNSAYVPYDGKEVSVQNIEVLCAPPGMVRWVPSGNGRIPPNAIPGGNTSSGEPLYIGRARYQMSLTPGKVHPSHQTCYISFGGSEVSQKMYDVLCSMQSLNAKL